MRRRSELSMLNPTPAMIQQAASMRAKEQKAAAMLNQSHGGSAHKHKRAGAQ